MPTHPGVKTFEATGQLRFKEHLEWAQAQGQLEEVGFFLQSLPESQWCHFGEI